MTPDPLETVSYTTLRGSVVTLPFLTVEQRDAAVENLSAPPVEPLTLPEAAETKACGQCQGNGGWTEQQEQTSANGSVVIVPVWVNCRPCGGTGKVPK